MSDSETAAGSPAVAGATFDPAAAGWEPYGDDGFIGLVGPFWARPSGDSYLYAFKAEPKHHNRRGVVHGGMLMAFADTAFGHAVSMHRKDHYWVTVRLVTDFLSAAKLGDWVEGTAEVMGIEDDIYTVKGRIWCGDRTIMTGTGVFKTLGKRPPRR